MSRCILLLFLFALPAFAQKNTFEMKAGAWETAWGSQGNGGGDGTLLMLPQACIYGPLHITDGADILTGGSICIRGAHGNIHFADFGSGIFIWDDEGYVFPFFVHPERARTEVRDFANGVH